jgi:hypothetical protein
MTAMEEVPNQQDAAEGGWQSLMGDDLALKVCIVLQAASGSRCCLSSEDSYG